MRRSLVLAFVLAAVACGGKQKQDPQPPVAETTPAPASKPDPQPTAPPVVPVAEKPAPPPAGPVDLVLPAPTATVKLLSAGKGKKAQLRVMPKQGGKQAVELAIDVSQQMQMGGEKEADTVPTVVIGGNAEVKNLGKDSASYQLVVTTTDTRDTKATMKPEKLEAFRGALGGLVGMTLDSTIAPNGAPGELKLHLDRGDQTAKDVMSVFRVVLPQWPVLPNEAIGVGAKWQVVSTGKAIEDKIDVTQTTDYELVKHDGNTWTIKGTTKVSGKDQPLGGAQVSKIAGTGTVEATLVDGALYPTMKVVLATEFEASSDGHAATLTITRMTQVTPK